MQAYRSERTTVGAELRWVHFLLRSTLFCAIVLMGGAAIMWVAANWQHWSYASRITLIVIAFTIPLLLAMRCGQHNPKDWAKPLSVPSMLLVLAALMVGALLALLGQLYHSGADSWRLFAWWVVLLIPWAVGLQSLPIILLSWFLTNVSISLLIVTSFYFSGHFVLSLGLALWNGLFFIVFSAWSLKAPHIGAVMRPLSFSIFVFFWALSFVEFAHQRFSQVFFSAPWLLGMLTLLMMGWLFLRRRQPLFAWLSYSAAIAALALHLTVIVVPQTGWGMYLLLLVPFGVLALFAQIRRSTASQAERLAMRTDSAPPAVSSTGSKLSASELTLWSVRGLRLLIMGVGAVFWASFLSLWGQLPLALFAWLLFAFSLVLGIPRPWKKAHWWADLWLMTWIAALLTMTVVWSRGELSLLGFIIVGLIAWLWYVWSNAPMVRVVTAFWGVFVLWAWPWIAPYSALWQFDAAVFDARLSVLLVGVFLLTGAYQWGGQRQRRRWLPLLLALWFWLLVIGLGYCLLTFKWGLAEGSLPIFSSLSTFIFATMMWSVLRPVLGGLMGALGWVAAVCLAFIWWPIPWLTLSFAALLYSGYIGVRSGVHLFFLLFVALIALWYEATTLTLLDKVGRLVLSAGLLGTLAITLDYVLKPSGNSILIPSVGGGRSSSTPASEPRRLGRVQLASLIVGAAAVYGSSGWFVYAQERILRHGVSFDLALMPADPRSLIQGDYMALRFDLNQNIRLLQHQNPQFDWPHVQMKVWVLPRKKSGARFYAVQVEGQNYLVQYVQRPLFAQYYSDGLPTQRRSSPHPLLNLVPIYDQGVLDNAIAIVMKKKQGEWTPDGVNAWFFSEGQGLAYSHAQWGRFKANGRGAVVLETLLNAQRQPID